MIELEPPRTAVTVPGGELTVGVFNHGVHTSTSDGSAVLAVHGITANHRCWPFVAAAVPEARIIAPDLRGRGGSRDVHGPGGLRRHADDLVAVLDACEVPVAHVVGHSMGAFVAVLLAARYPDRVRTLTLVDGGLPLDAPAAPVPAGTSLLGPAGARLSMTFGSVEEYRAFWRRHPAFANHWSAAVQGYVDYDLVGTAPQLRSSVVLASVETDAAELFGPDWYLEAMGAVDAPATLLRAPRGLLDEPRALYAPGRAFAEPRLHDLRVVEVEDVNHYTIVQSSYGAAAVADELRRSMSSASALREETA